MYKNAHLQNITRGPERDTMEREERISKAGTEKRRRPEENRVVCGFSTGMVLIMWVQKQTSPQIKAAASGVTSADPRTKPAPFTADSNHGNPTFNKRGKLRQASMRPHMVQRSFSLNVLSSGDA